MGIIIKFRKVGCCGRDLGWRLIIRPIRRARLLDNSRASAELLKNSFSYLYVHGRRAIFKLADSIKTALLLR